MTSLPSVFTYNSKTISIPNEHVCWVQYFNTSPAKNSIIVKVKDNFKSSGFLDSYLTGTQLEYIKSTKYSLGEYKPVNMPAHVYYKFLDSQIYPMTVYLNKKYLEWDVKHIPIGMMSVSI